MVQGVLDFTEREEVHLLITQRLPYCPSLLIKMCVKISLAELTNETSVINGTTFQGVICHDGLSAFFK